MTTCCIKECERPVFACAMCSLHYTRVRKYGNPNRVRLNQLHGATLMERLLHYTRKAEGCWEWQGYRDPNGYGRLNVRNYPELAHRISWTLHRSELEPGQQVLHHCDNPGCVNPDHLFLGDPAANVADMHAKGRARKRASHGEAHGCAKLTEVQVREIRASSGPSRIIAEQYGVSGRQVRDIRAGRVWRHIIL